MQIRDRAREFKLAKRNLNFAEGKAKLNERIKLYADSISCISSAYRDPVFCSIEAKFTKILL